MKQEMIEEIDRLGKDELMERIKTECAKEQKEYSSVAKFWLFILVMNMIGYGTSGNHNWSGCLFPAYAVVFCCVEVWWRNRMNKCTDAWSLVTTYGNYSKLSTVSSFIALLLWFPICYYVFRDWDPDQNDKVSLVISIIVSVAVLLYIIWVCFFKKKSLTAREVKRLRDMIP